MIPLSDARVATLRADLRAIGGSTCARLLRRCVELLEDATADAESARATECASTAAILTDAAWEKLHTGDWKDAEPAWRSEPTNFSAHVCAVCWLMCVDM